MNQQTQQSSLQKQVLPSRTCPLQQQEDYQGYEFSSLLLKDISP
jgi:hypothetical protein